MSYWTDTLHSNYFKYYLKSILYVFLSNCLPPISWILPSKSLENHLEQSISLSKPKAIVQQFHLLFYDKNYYEQLSPG